MSKRATERRPSKEEFFQAIESEFSFLIQEEACSKEVTGEYSVAFAKGGLRLEIAGASYGLAIDASFTVHGKYCPVWSLIPEAKKRQRAPRSDAPQLDQIRDCAKWLREDLRGLFQGDPEFIGKIEALLAEQRRQEASRERIRQEGKRAKFFEEAERLFKAGKYQDCVRYLEAGSMPLTDSWRARLDYARRHA